MNPISVDLCQHSSFQECQLNIEKIQSYWQKKNRLLILSDRYSSTEICKKLHDDLFKGIVVFDNFHYKGQRSLHFNLVDREVSIKIIKKEIATYLDKKVSDIALACFPTAAPLKDDDDLFNALNFHGLGGEVIHLRSISKK